MFNKIKLSRVAMAVALSVGLSATAMAQETSASFGGTITGPEGQSAAGTVITVTHVPSGSTKRVVVGANGTFALQGLRVGGPYTVAIDSDQFEDQTVNDVFLKLGEPGNLALALQSEQDVERIIVTASSLGAAAFGATSPASHFDLGDLQQAAAADRDLKSVIRIDPRVNIEESDGEEAIICGGSNPRFSSLTVDGVRMNDSFGLNFNGYPTVRMPFSFDAIDQVSIELAPFDVQYGGFTACNINAVTKSGTNEVHGSVFLDYTNDSFTGDKIAGEDIDTGNFTEKRYGFNVGFPLIKDKLFFFGAYEKLEGAQLFDYGALGDQVSQADLNRIIAIARDVYNYDAGGTPASAPVEDEKLLMKLDWNINDDHRASLVYNFNDGFRLDQSDQRNNTVTLDNHFYEVGAELNSLVGSLYSDWTDSFSTELRIGYIELDNRQESLDAASGFGEIRIERINGASVYIGPDDSRQSNDLNWNNLTFKLAGTYYLGDHKLTGGIERENLEIFNLFMQHTIGEYRFNGIDDFANGIADDIYYNNSAGTNNPDDAAANFEYATNAAYIQDEFTVDDFTFIVGLRYDWYTSSDKPRQNEVFERNYGYSNTATFDGKSLLQPRFAFNYVASDALEIRGGIGLYSGGNPNVWLSNSYSNDGITNIDTYRRDLNLLNPDGTLAVDLAGEGRLIYDPLQDMVDEVAENDPALGNEPSVNALDPDFEIPNEWKYNLGFTYATENDYIIQGDILHSVQRDSALIVAESWDAASRTELFDGRAVYDYATVSDGEGNTRSRSFRKSDLVLTNAQDNGKATTISLAVSKEFESGFSMNVGYAFNKAEDVSPMTSAVSFSNFANFATTDALNPSVATSNYETPHRFTFNLRYSHEFFDGFPTSFSLFGSRTAGRPLSYTFNELTVGATEFRSRRHLLYIPLENDPNVTFDSGFDLAGFNAWVDENGFTRGEVLARNSSNSDWHTRVDFRVNQKIPGFMDDHSANVFFVVRNLGNLLNDDWGVKRVGNFVAQDVVQADIESDGTYTYNEFFISNSEQEVFNTQSLWEVRFGIRYRF